MSKKPKTEMLLPWEYENPLCREVGGEMFFPGDMDDPDSLDANASNIKLAKNICKKCDHVVECAEWGVHHEEFGVWGGLGSGDRKVARRKRNISLKSASRYFVD